MNLCPQPKQLKLSGGVAVNGSSSCGTGRHRPDIEYRQDDSIGHEAYRLCVSEHAIVIESSGAPGRFYAEQTLFQIGQVNVSGIPCLEIEDSPDFPVRGYMLDVSRCKVPKMEQLYQLIDLLAHFKYNQFQLYFEHVFRYPRHERVWQHASAFSGEEIACLDAN